MTVTVHLAVAEPHVAVMVAVPAATAVTLPLLTVATLELDVVHVTVPEAVAVNVALLPATKDKVELLKETESVVVEEEPELLELEELPTVNVTEPTYARLALVAMLKLDTLIALLGVYV